MEQNSTRFVVALRMVPKARHVHKEVLPPFLNRTNTTTVATTMRVHVSDWEVMVAV